MIEWIVILLIIFCILVWHYSQSTKKYSITQLRESQISTNLTSLWEEKNPIVISEAKSFGIWSSDSLRQTRFWGAQPIWNEYDTRPVIFNPSKTRSLQTTWSDILGLTKIESDLVLKWYDLSPVIFSTRTEAHIGYEGLRKTYGWSTAISCTQGEIRCILLNNSQMSRLPPGWKGLRWLDATIAHHPLWTQVQTIEIILRPSNVLLVPPHWIIAIEPIDIEKPIWWTRTDLHHPISKMAQKWNEDNV
jgi:NADH:ubiquinone oxidoreductase subunit